jgi:hypothetical protein
MKGDAMNHKQLLQRWQAQWIALGREHETEEELGQALLAFINVTLQLQHPLLSGLTEDDLLSETIRRLKSPSELGPEHSITEATLRRLVEDPADAIRYISTAKQQHSASQSQRGSKPRPRSKDSITQAIEEILEETPQMTAKNVGRALEGHEDIDLIDDEYRHRSDASTLKVSNLSSRVSNAKKRVSCQPG